tara:strand:- start:24 stop:560 length:537 start_codon:yes stop_codon:yes gene_type:complete
MMKKKLAILPYVTFICIVLIFFYLLIIQRNPSEIPSAFINKKIPKFESVSILDKKQFFSYEHFNDEITLVNFFATWCKPCRDEHVFIKKLAEKDNIKVLGINYKDDPKKAIKWIKDLGNPYYEILIDKNGRIAIEWGVYGIPETFVVNSKKIIKYRHVGPINEKSYKKINTIIREIKK